MTRLGKISIEDAVEILRLVSRSSLDQDAYIIVSEIAEVASDLLELDNLSLEMRATVVEVASMAKDLLSVNSNPENKWRLMSLDKYFSYNKRLRKALHNNCIEDFIQLFQKLRIEEDRQGFLKTPNFGNRSVSDMCLTLKELDAPHDIIDILEGYLNSDPARRTAYETRRANARR